MRLLLDSFWRASAYCLHPRVIGLSLVPLLVMGVAAFALGYFFWEPAVAAVTAWLQTYELKAGLVSLLERLGFVNVMAESSSRYPVLQPEEIQALRPDVICLSSEPYPFREQHIEELKALCPQAQITLVDGEMFSWYGSRLMQSIPYFQKWIQPWQ